MPTRRRRVSNNNNNENTKAKRNGAGGDSSGMISSGSASASGAKESRGASGGTKRKKTLLWIASISLALVAAISVTLIVVYVVPDRDDSAGGAAATAGRASSTASDGGGGAGGRDESPTVITKFGSYRLLETVPHDASAFTQGLCLKNATTAYEGTGLYGGKSEVRLVNIPTGRVLQQVPLASQYFGEGLAYYETSRDDDGDGAGEEGNRGRLVQITWKERTGFVYDSDTFEVLQQFEYETHTGEGWGITYDGTAGNHRFYVTDGSRYLMTWNASTMQQIDKKEVVVLRQSDTATSTEPVPYLNEIEYDPFTDTILSNVWYQDVIVRIDPKSGRITTVYDLSTLYPDRPESADVLNGIALTTTNDANDGNDAAELWVTGKFWPHMFRIRLLEPE